MDKLKKLSLLEERIRLQEGLPHLYGFKMYPWMREFFESRNKMNLLCSGNQIGKSSIQIRKAIHWATAPNLWKELWPHHTPRQFWYLYPSSIVATIEFDTKWVPEFLPRNEFKSDPIFGWTAEYRNRLIQCVKFNSGVNLYMKTYSQDPQDLQAGSVAAEFTDEEPPSDLMPELQARLFSTDGYFHAVFTPTLAQEYFREAIEVRGLKERFPDAFKKQVSMYDCLTYEDGTPSFWNEKRIERVKNSCKSEAEVQRRVYGKFVSESGLKYPSFSRDRNIINERQIPDDYRIFVGVDMGSGGENHPAAVTFVAVSSNYQKGFVFKGRRFDNMITTASDVVELVQQMRAGLNVDAIFYDHAATDLREIAARMGESWIPAQKSHAVGEGMLNVLFKNQMLSIFDLPELEPLVLEFCSLKMNTPKQQASDDMIDSCRYAVSKIPWDWSVISGEKIEITREKTEIQIRREAFMEKQSEYDINEELEMWNELY